MVYLRNLLSISNSVRGTKCCDHNALTLGRRGDVEPVRVLAELLLVSCFTMLLEVVTLLLLLLQLMSSINMRQEAGVVVVLVLLVTGVGFMALLTKASDDSAVTAGGRHCGSCRQRGDM
jgi:hypothetical protein